VGKLRAHAPSTWTAGMLLGGGWQGRVTACLPCCRGPGDVSDLAAKTSTSLHVRATLFTPEESSLSRELIKGLLPSWVSRFDQEPWFCHSVVKCRGRSRG